LLKGLRKRLLETESTEEIETLKKQMHVAEVDLNYAQYFPLSEVYVSLYPNKATPDLEGPKPPMWAEVEKCMEDETLGRLRNRVSNAPVSAPRKVQIKPAKPKPQAPPVDTSGLNRRERRKLLGATEATKHKNKSTAFEKNHSFGASEGTKTSTGLDVADDGGDSDGGFFE
jgi:hypothetical protein